MDKSRLLSMLRGGCRDPFAWGTYQKKDSDPPDYKPVAEASAEAARISAQLGEKQLAEAKRQFDRQMEVARPVVDQQLQIAQQQQAQGADYYNYAKQNGRPVEQQLMYEAMGYTPEEVAQINASRKAESAAAQALAQEEAVNRPPQTFDVPTYTLQDDVPAGAIKGSATGQRFSTVPNPNPRPLGMMGLSWSPYIQVPIDPNAYYKKGPNGQLTAVGPIKQKVVEGTKTVTLPNGQVVSAADATGSIPTPDTDELAAQLAMQASARQKAADKTVRDERQAANTTLANRVGMSNADVYEANRPDIDAETAQAVADSRNGYTNATNMAIRQGLRYGFNPDSLAAAVGNTSLANATAQASAANTTRKAATETMYGRGIGQAQVALSGLDTARSQKQQDEAIATAKKQDVAGLYRNLPGTSQGSYSLAIGAGNAATQNNNAPSNTLLSGMNAGAGTIMQGQQQKLAGLTSILGNQTSQSNANSGNDAALWGTLGSVAGAFISDEEKKSDIKNVKDAAALDGLTRTPVKQWKYDPAKGGPDDGGKEHVGAMAEDMQKNLGAAVSDGKQVDVVNAIGVTMAAVRALDDKVEAISRPKPKAKKEKVTA